MHFLLFFNPGLETAKNKVSSFMCYALLRSQVTWPQSSDFTRLELSDAVSMQCLGHWINVFSRRPGRLLYLLPLLLLPLSGLVNVSDLFSTALGDAPSPVSSPRDYDIVNLMEMFFWIVDILGLSHSSSKEDTHTSPLSTILSTILSTAEAVAMSFAHANSSEEANIRGSMALAHDKCQTSCPIVWVPRLPCISVKFSSTAHVKTISRQGYINSLSLFLFAP